METSTILTADVLDIIFEGKNKTYGAYELRKSYDKRLTVSVTVMLSLVGLFVTGFLFAGSKKKMKVQPIEIVDPHLTNVDPLKPVVLPPLPPPPAAASPKETFKTVKNLIPKIVPDDQAPEQNEVPENESLKDVQIGSLNTNGELSGYNEAPPGPKGNGDGVVEHPKAKEDGGNGRFEPVEIEAIYPGGTPAWQRFLNKTIRYPQEAVDISVSGIVVIEFIVDTDGSVSQVNAISGPAELRSEAERVIRKSGKWEPAIQNGRKVKSYKRQPIVFKLTEE